MATWSVIINYGSGNKDITDLVDIKSFRRIRSIYNNLCPTINSLTFQMLRDATTITGLLTASSDITITITKDSAAYFKGYIRNNFKITIRNQVLPLKIECIDNARRLQRKIGDSYTWIGYKVCDPDNPTTSIVHALLDLAGYTSGEINVTMIDKTIDYFLIRAGSDSFFELLKALLFEHGYVFYHDESGDFCIFEWNASTITTTKYFSNTVADHNINGELEFETRGFEVNGIDLQWWAHNQATELTPVFSETQGAKAGYNCYVSIPADGYYPDSANDQDVYVEYQAYEKVTRQTQISETIAGHWEWTAADWSRGKLLPTLDWIAEHTVQRMQSFQSVEASANEIICVPDTVTFTVEGTDIALETSVNEYTRAKIKIHNTDIVNANRLTKFEILGYPILRGDTNLIKRRFGSGDEKAYVLKSAYLVTEADAEKLCVGIERYFRNSPFRYRLRSTEDWNPGDYVYVDEDFHFGTFQLCIIIAREDNEYEGIYTYTLEGVAAYEAETVSVQSNHHAPAPVPKTAINNIHHDFESPSGNGTIENPVEGDRLHSRVGSVDQYYEFTGGQWVSSNSIMIGLLVNALFLAMVGCYGVFVPDNPPTTTETLPHPNFRVFNFENNYQDQNGLDDWSTKTNLAFDTAWYKFGSRSLWATDTNIGTITSPTNATVGNSQALGAWFKINYSATTPNSNDQLLLELYDGSGNNYIRLYAHRDADVLNFVLYLEVKQNGNLALTYTTEDLIPNNTVSFIGCIYDSSNNTIYIVGNNIIYNAGSPIYSWTGTTWQIYAHPYRNHTNGSLTPATIDVHIDELLFYYNKALDPNYLAQHYTHNVPWETAYSKQDLLWRPGVDGRNYTEHVIKSTNDIQSMTGFKNSLGEYKYSWHRVTNPPTGFMFTKTSGWTADTWVTVDISAYVTAGTKAVKVVINVSTTSGKIFVRPYNDTNISSTPQASSEWSCIIARIADTYQEATIDLSSDYKFDIAVENVNSDVNISYPRSELRQ